jgi:hypothetical protein
MSATTARMLRAASEVLGGDEALAQHLGISEVQLGTYLEDLSELPDTLLLRTVDIVLEQPALPPIGLPPGNLQESAGDV